MKERKHNPPPERSWTAFIPVGQFAAPHRISGQTKSEARANLKQRLGMKRLPVGTELVPAGAEDIPA